MEETSSLILEAQARAIAARNRLEAAGSLKTVTRYCPHTPSKKQSLFLEQTDLEVMYGGAAGGGKSDALLMAALEHVDNPNYSALILRRRMTDLELADTLIPRSQAWLAGTDAEWSERKKTWRFPSGATISFGHVETEADKYKYQSAAFQFIGFDELTQFSETQYAYLFSRLRRTDESIPLRVRSATNPSSDPQSMWVFERFVENANVIKDGVLCTEFYNSKNEFQPRIFIPASLIDNPYLDQEAYLDSLDRLDPVTRAQLLHGDWHIRAKGNIFDNWDERYHVITESEFKRVFGVNEMPLHWRIGRFHDYGSTPGHPAIILNIARASQNSAIPGLVIVYREQQFVYETISEIADQIKKVEKFSDPDGEFHRMSISVMSHEQNAVRRAYIREHGIHFDPWTQDRDGGIATIRDYLKIYNDDKPNPFRSQLYGCPKLICVVADGQGEMEENRFAKNDEERWIVKLPKDHAGMIRLRGEVAAYKWSDAMIGGKLMPIRLYNDAMDCLRAAAMMFFPAITGLTIREKFEEALPDYLQINNIMAEKDLTKRADLAMLRQIEKDIALKKLKTQTYKPVYL